MATADDAVGTSAVVVLMVIMDCFAVAAGGPALGRRPLVSIPTRSRLPVVASPSARGPAAY